MYKAASSHSKLETMVTLFEDIGSICRELEMKEIARAHYLLAFFVRNEQGWSISDALSSAINELNEELNSKQPAKIQEALRICRKEWERTTNVSQTSPHKKRSPRRGLTGTVILGREDRPFCFISGDDKESYFCFKADLPKVIDGQKVIFNAIPSFDKKKDKESWKAVDIRRV